MKHFMILGASLLLSVMATWAQRYVGGDISLLPKYEAAGAKYKTHSGEPINDLLPWCREQGMNAMRVRLFVDPSKYKGSDADPNACQDLEYIIPLCQRIVNNGFALLLDFHYSDTWADPAKQYTPADWKDLTDEQLYVKIYEYTRDCLIRLREAGVTPAFIQPGNEISYGMLWGPEGTSSSQQKKAYMGSENNWGRFTTLLKNAIKGCKEICPDAKIILHTERVANIPVQNNFYSQMAKYGVEYDIIGLSYYPYFHGDMSVLNSALTSLEANFPSKDIMIVETGYSYKWEVPGTTHDLTSKYPYTEAGQDKFAHDLVDTLEAHAKVNGLFWWWMEYNAYNTSLSGWYNAPLFDSLTGKATPALTTICSFATSSGAINDVLNDADSNGEVHYYGIDGRKVDGPIPGRILIRKQGQKADKVIFK